MVWDGPPGTWQQRGAIFEAFQKIRACVKAKSTTEEINSILLLATDDKGRMVLYMAANRGKLELLQEILDWAEENLTTEEINILLLATDLEKNDCLARGSKAGQTRVIAENTGFG